MSEPLLKAILRLFAIVAKEDEVTHHERDQIRFFLEDHLSRSAVDGYLSLFDDYARNLPAKTGDAEELIRLHSLCAEVTPELTQRQKVVILLEIMGIIQADKNVTQREVELTRSIGENFKVKAEEIDAIKTFVTGNTPHEMDHDHILIIDTQHTTTLSKAKHIYRHHLDGFVARLYLEYSEIYFIKYLGKSDVYLNGVPVKILFPRM